ncbi:MAG TPA: YbdK family carboxylate-amine ligase [Rhodocyclaceae bacterium]|nr:YbdK family carboxylate-amine ligase [Rhodocyclaceae bacterium]
MPLQAFSHSKPLSMGVELELQLVDPHSLDLTCAAEDLLHVLERKPFPGEVKPEMTESMIEVATGVHDNYEALLGQLREIRNALVSAGDKLNLRLAGGGTHAFQHWSDQAIVRKPRYLQLSELYGYLAKQFTVFGQHVHIGCEDANSALFLLHSLNRYLPHFIALSASSPFFQGEDTLFDSARLNSVFAFPLSGRAPFVLDWDSFESGYFRKMEATGVVTSMKDFYWDIRPKPEFGTIELRVCDTPLTVERAAALACYLQALCSYLLTCADPSPTEDDYLVYNFNRFQACRFGLDGTVVDPRSNKNLPLREDILQTLDKVQTHAGRLGSRAALDEIRRILAEGNHASYLRREFAQCRNVRGVVDATIRAFRGGA